MTLLELSGFLGFLNIGLLGLLWFIVFRSLVSKG